jgi:FAD/FMN-containing dehydrogenase
MDRLTPGLTWLDDLRQALGAAQVLTDSTELAFYAQDVFSEGAPLDAVVRPRDVSQVATVMRVLASAGVAVHARGGGLSYTEGYLAQRRPAVVLDLSLLDKLVELNVADRYVTVECGMTWAALDALLALHGLRTPYWGPLSGLRSTIGGALSQGSVFLGSGEHGAVGDSVLGMDVVTANGESLVTGAAAAGNTPPFTRWFGPDLTGLFVGDAGALGTKVRATLRLLPRPSELGGLSYEFDDAAAAMAVMSELSRRALAAECFAFDPFLVEQRLKRASLMSDAKTLMGVVKQSGLLAGAKLVAAGRGFVGTGKWSVHATFDAHDKASLRAKVDAAKAVFDSSGGVAIDASIPIALRGLPFSPPNTILGPAGERWVPVHGIFAHSQAARGWAAVSAALAQHQAVMRQHSIQAGTLLTTVAAQGMLIEPVFFWPDSHSSYHKRVVEAGYQQRCGEPATNLAARAAVVRIKRDVADAMRAQGAVHFQIGRFYDWRAGRNPAALAVFDAIKAAVDPQGLLNPGVLR